MRPPPRSARRVAQSAAPGSLLPLPALRAVPPRCTVCCAGLSFAPAVPAPRPPRCTVFRAAAPSAAGPLLPRPLLPCPLRQAPERSQSVAAGPAVPLRSSLPPPSSPVSGAASPSAVRICRVSEIFLKKICRTVSNPPRSIVLLSDEDPNGAIPDVRNDRRTACRLPAR